MPDFRITINGLWVGKSLVDFSTSKLEWTNLLGEEPRIMPATALAPDWRELWLFDEAGLYLLREKSADKSLCVSFVWELDQTSNNPRRAFSGILQLNGIVLKAGMRENQFPLNGVIEFQKSIGKRYGAELGPYSVHVKFTKTRNRFGKRVEPAKLAYLQFSWSVVGLPGNVVQERLRKN